MGQTKRTKERNRREPSVQELPEAVPADAALVAVPGEVDDEGLPDDIFEFDEAPETAVVALVAVVAHDENRPFGDLDGSQVVPALDRLRVDDVLHVDPVEIVDGLAVEEDLLVP